MGSFSSIRWGKGPFLEYIEKSVTEVLKIAGLILYCYNEDKVYIKMTVKLRNFHNFYQFFK